MAQAKECRPRATRRNESATGSVTLLIDADDTLWENNIHFIEVTEHLLQALERFGVDRESATALLLDTEDKNIRDHGYGSRSFALSVVETFSALCPHEDGETVERLRALAYSIFNRDSVELRAGAEATLARLSRAHRLVLVTKGDEEEQARKLAVSGLRPHFEEVEIVAEKNESTYRAIVERLHLDPDNTWMIGNSPRSDINPALDAGLRAILIPHPHTWEKELEEIDRSNGRLQVFASLEDVADYFSA